MGKRYISKPDKEQNVTSTAHKRTLSNVKGKKINPGANVVATACKDGILYKQAAKPPLLYFIFYVLFQNYY